MILKARKSPRYFLKITSIAFIFLLIKLGYIFSKGWYEAELEYMHGFRCQVKLLLLIKFHRKTYTAGMFSKIP